MDRIPTAPPSRRTEGRRHVRASLAAAIGFAALLAACSSAATPSPAATPAVTSTPAAVASPSPAPSPSPAFPLDLVDDEGHAIRLAAEPARIVSLTPATTEIAFALGAGPRVIATTDFDDYPPEALNLAHVATFDSVDVEKIVGLKADLVIAGGNNFNKPSAIQRLRDLGVPVLTVYGKDVAGVLADIRLVGTAIGEGTAAADLAASMRAQIDQIAAATASLPHPRTFYELDATKEIYGPADGSFVVEMISLAGGDPITTGSTTVFSIPLERLVGADPEVIVLGDAAYGTTPAVVRARSGWATMSAVKSGAIRPVTDLVVTRPGPRLAEGLRGLALAIHPDLVLPPAPGASASAAPSSSPVPSASAAP
jgi:iron complex transport system substrate-binding protein